MPLIALALLIVVAPCLGRHDGGWEWAMGGSFADLLPLRLPRVAVALGAGVMFGMAGAGLQRITGNAMAAPEVLGVSAGAALGVIALMLLTAELARVQILVAACLGAVCALLVLFAIGRREAAGGERLLLAGVAVTTAASAMEALVLASGDPRLDFLLAWMSGYHLSRQCGDAVVTLTGMAATLILLPLAARRLEILPLGPAVARSLGLDPVGSRLVIVGLIAIPTAIATVAMGPLSFVGLLGPHGAHAGLPPRAAAPPRLRPDRRHRAGGGRLVRAHAAFPLAVAGRPDRRLCRRPLFSVVDVEGAMSAEPIFALTGAGFEISGHTLPHPLDLALERRARRRADRAQWLRQVDAAQAARPPAAGEPRRDPFRGQALGATGATRDFARRLAYLPQSPPAVPGLKVREFVAFGRYPWHGSLGRFSATDRTKVEEAMVLTDIVPFADRMVDTLSGGERQRVWLAMLVAQDTQCLLLDEPISALDIAHQVEVLALVRRLAMDRDLAVIIVLHDVNMAARFCDEIVALHSGRLIVRGGPSDIMTPQRLYEIYGLAMGVMASPADGQPIGYPL